MKRFSVFVFLAFVGYLALYAQMPAFPGAEGFGKNSLGARAVANPQIYHVTNLNDAGTGSLRDAISQPGRIVVFDVAGVIKINSRLVFSSNLTVAGQTAPGDGISVYGNGVSFSGAKNVIVRYMRFRMGVKGDSGKDAAGIANGSEMIFDHCSFNWGLDETFSISWDGKGTEPGNITIQNSIIGQGIMTHSAGGLIQTDGGITLFRNLYIDNKTRNPKVKGLNQYINNVVYNWGSGGGYILGDTEASSWGDIQHNYFIKGPSTGGTSAFNRANAWFQVYNEGNFLDYSLDGELNGVVAQEPDFGPVTFVASSSSFTGSPKLHPVIVSKSTALEAYQYVIDSVGACLPARDEVDKYLISEVKSLGTKGALINGEADLGLANGVGNVFKAKQQLDTDLDGIPDFWEDANGLDKKIATDALQLHSSGYLHIELYLNSIASTVAFVKYPTLLSVKQLADTFVVLKWTNHEENASEIVLEVSSDNQQFTELKVLDPSAVEYKVEGLKKSTVYYFRLKTRRAELESLNTEAVKAVTTGADAPPALCNEPIPADGAFIPAFVQTNLNWSNPSALSGVIYYNLYVGTSPDALVQKTAGSLTNSFNLAVSPGLTYYWRVDAMNLLGIQTGDLWSFTTGFRQPREKVAYFPLDEIDGTITNNDVEGYASALNFIPTWVHGKINNGISLPGSPTNAALMQSHYNAISLGNESFSVELWFKSSGGAVDWYLIHKGSHAKNATTGSTGKWFGIQYNKTGSNDRLTWAIDDDLTKTDLNISPGSAYFDNQWHHLVVVRDVELDQLRAYVDGVLRGAKTDATGDISQTENLVLGNTNNPNADPTNAFAGLMDEVSIYQGVMTEAEIVESYQFGLQSKLAVVDNLLKVFPMPFENHVYLTGVSGECSLRIYDITGRLVYNTVKFVDSNEFKLEGLGELSKGSYILNLNKDGVTNSIRIFK